MPEPKRNRSLDARFKYRPSTIVRKEGAREYLLKKIRQRLREFSVDPDNYYNNLDIVNKLNYLLSLKLATPQQQRWAISLLKYLDAKESGKISTGSRNVTNNLEINKLHLKIMILKRQLKIAESTGSKADVERIRRLLESAEHQFDQITTPIHDERQREIEFTSLGKQIIDYRDQLNSDDSQRHRKLYEEAISGFDQKYIPYLEELVDETKKIWGYENADIIVKGNPKYLQSYLDLQVTLDKIFTIEGKMNFLEKELPKFKDAPFYDRVLNKQFIKYSQELNQSKIERKKYVVPENLGYGACLKEVNRLKRIALSGQDVFLEDIIAIFVRTKNKQTFNFVLSRIIGSLPKAKQLSLQSCVKVLGFLSFLHEFDYVKTELYFVEQEYNARVKQLQKKQPINQPVVTKKDVGEFLFGVNANKFDEASFISEFIEELEPFVKDISINDAVDTLIYLVKGACLFSSKKALGGGYFPSEYFRGNVENALRSYYGSDNRAWARIRIERVSEILKKVDVLQKDKKLMSLNNTRDYKSKTIRKFVEFVLSMNK